MKLKPKTTKIDTRLFLIVIGVAFLIALEYVFTTPLWKAPDEPSHIAYIDYVQRYWSLPSPLKSHPSKDVQRSTHWYGVPLPLPSRPKVPSAEDFAYRGLIYVANHPPLYYFGSLPFADIGSRLANNRIIGMAYGARVFSALFTSLTVGLAYLVSRRLKLPPPESIVIALLVLLQPQFMHIGTSINNDSLAIFFFSLLVFYLVTEIQQRSRWRPLRLGAVIGLGLLTKATFLLALPLTFLALWLSSAQLMPSLKVLKRFASVAVVGGLISGWWYARNRILYGTFWYVIGSYMLGPAKFDEFFRISKFYRLLFISYWGYFGGFEKLLPDFFFSCLLIMSFAASTGILAKILSNTSRNPSSVNKRALVFFVAVFAILFLGAISFRITARTTQGRYSLPGIIPATILMWLGLKYLVGERLRIPLAILLISFFGIMSYTGLSLIGSL